MNSMSLPIGLARLNTSLHFESSILESQFSPTVVASYQKERNRKIYKIEPLGLMDRSDQAESVSTSRFVVIVKFVSCTTKVQTCRLPAARLT